LSTFFQATDIGHSQKQNTSLEQISDFMTDFLFKFSYSLKERTKIP